MSKDEKIVFCTGGGCTAKLGAGVLSRILEKAAPAGEKGTPEMLLVGAMTAGMMPPSTALQKIWPWCRRWTFSHPWWMTPIPSGRSQRPTP